MPPFFVGEPFEMSDRLKELRAKRGKIVHDMRGLTDTAQTEKRDLTAEELKSHSDMFDEVEKLGQQITAEERSLEASRLFADRQEQEERGENGAGEERKGQKTVEELRMAAFRTYLQTGKVAGEGAEEFRAFQAGSSAEGGYLVAPQQFVEELLKGLDDQIFIRDMANVIQLPTAASLGAPTLDADAEDWDWTTELRTGAEEDSLRFGKRELKPHPLAKRVKISKTLMRKAPRVEQIVMQRLAYKLGLTQEKAFLLGDGHQKPLGVFTASADGIPTSRDVATGNTATEIQFDGLIEAKYSLKAPYWANASWMFHRDAVKKLTKLKDLEGQYVWQPSVRDGEPDRILSLPFRVSEHVPNTFTTGQYVGIIGDFSYYWIVEALDMQMQRLVELYAESNQDGFIGRYEGDGMPVLAEAFARVKLG